MLKTRRVPRGRRGPPPPAFQGNGAALLCFLHIPKTAGTAVTAALAAHFDTARIYPSYSETTLRAEDAAALRARYDFMQTHAGANVAFAKATHVFTVLRDPVARILSLYNYWRSVPLEAATVFEHGLVDPAVVMAKAMSFEEFVFSDHKRLRHDLHNGMAYQLATSHTDQGRRRAFWMGRARVLARASANLARMGAVGVTEDLPAFAAAVERAYGLPLRIDRRNVTAQRSVDLAALGHDARARIEALTELDLTLYDRVRSGRIEAAA